MGKRNIRVKKYRDPITKSNIMAKVLPNYLTIVESREKFVENLKSIFIKYQKEFSLIIQAHLKRLPIKNMKKKTFDSFTCSDFHYHDNSGELFFIYQIQFEHFIAWLLESLQDVYFQNRQIMKVCIRDSEVLLQHLVKETERVTFGIFDQDEVWKEYFSTPWYNERILQAPIVKQFLEETQREQPTLKLNQDLKSKESPKKRQESRDWNCRKETWESPENKESRDGKENKEHKNGKKKNENVENLDGVDEEVEEFRKKLELESVRDDREKPHVTLDWIAGIKKKLVRG